VIGKMRVHTINKQEKEIERLEQIIRLKNMKVEFESQLAKKLGLANHDYRLQLTAANVEIERLLREGRKACDAWNEELTEAKEEIARLTERPN